MELDEIIPSILSSFDLDPSRFTIHRINSGHINYTYKVEPGYILQRVNKQVFTNPNILSNNLKVASEYLRQHTPDYLFLAALKSKTGAELVYDKSGYPWRLFPYIENTYTINEIDNPEQAYNAARAFAQLSKKLSQCDVKLFEETIPDFHNLAFRYSQFATALKSTSTYRKVKGMELLAGYSEFTHLVREYERLIYSGILQLRVTHNDTKINNVLFEKNSNNVVCVIDLDTLMPGYFIYDLGDMLRTFVSPVSEEEIDFSKIEVRRDIQNAVIEGYLSEMNDDLTDAERSIIHLAGPMMTYIMGLRFLTDYLNGDTYYQTTYPDQNLNRAANQLDLLKKLAP